MEEAGEKKESFLFCSDAGVAKNFDLLPTQGFKTEGPGQEQMAEVPFFIRE